MFVVNLFDCFCRKLTGQFSSLSDAGYFNLTSAVVNFESIVVNGR